MIGSVEPFDEKEAGKNRKEEAAEENLGGTIDRREDRDADRQGRQHLHDRTLPIQEFGLRARPRPAPVRIATNTTPKSAQE